MEYAFLIAIGLPFLCLVAAAAMYINDKEAKVISGWSAVLFFAAVLISGVAGSMVGGFILTPLFCLISSSPECGFGAGIILMSLSFSVFVTAFLLFWKKCQNF